MADEVKIDKDTFQTRLSHFISTWRNDKRQSNDALFGGVGSIVVLMGRNEENPSFHKNNAMHVRESLQRRERDLTGLSTVLVTGIRVPRNFDGLHSGGALYRHNSKER